MYAVETVKVGKVTVKIVPDEEPESPRDWDNLGTMVCWHRRYRLGDKHSFATPQDFEESEERKNAAVVLPLFLYDHSGLRIKVGSFHGLLPQGHAEFDSGQVGYIYISKKKVQSEYGDGPEALKSAEECLDAEVAVYDQYLRGDIYGFVVESESGEHLDSCWGFYGVESALEAGKEAAESCNEDEIEKERKYGEEHNA